MTDAHERPISDRSADQIKRIFIAVGNYGRWGETDGVVTTYQNLLPRFADSGVEVDAVTYGPDDDIEQIGPVTLYIHRPRLKVKVDPSRWIDFGLYRTRLAKLLFNRRYDLVQSSSPEMLGLLAKSLAENNHCPLLTVYHTNLDYYARIRFETEVNKPAGWIMGAAVGSWMRWYYGHSELILTPSEFMAERLRQTFEPQVEVWRRGVNTERFHPRLRQRHDHGFRAVYVGRVAPEKNLDWLVELFRDQNRMELVIVGDGPYLEAMKKKLPNAVYAGRLDGEDLARAYADADVFVFPSRTDTLGNVVLEAMSSGVPVIVSDAMGPKELVEPGTTGFVASSVADFKLALDRLHDDIGARFRMGQAARKSAERRSWDGIFRQLIDFYAVARRNCRR